jgi:hypothetical protein
MLSADVVHGAFMETSENTFWRLCRGRMNLTLCFEVQARGKAKVVERVEGFSGYDHGKLTSVSEQTRCG